MKHIDLPALHELETIKKEENKPCKKTKVSS